MPPSPPATTTGNNGDLSHITHLNDIDQSPTHTNGTTTTTAATKNNNNDNSANGRARKPKAPAQQEPVPPPDGGWGWVVVLSSFMVSVMVDGVCFTTGVFFDTFKLHFGTSNGQTAWVGSVLNGSYLTVGPLVSAFVNRYGCRPVAMFGAVFAGVAFFISTFSPSMMVLTITFGLLGGLGFGFLYLPAMVMVGYYFEKRRAAATGFACCGSGVGALIFAPFCNYLLESYGWKGATWILAGLVLNCLVFSMFYRALEHSPTGLSKNAGGGGGGGEDEDAEARLLGEGDRDDEGEAPGNEGSRAESSGTTNTAATNAAVVDVDVRDRGGDDDDDARAVRVKEIRLTLSGKKGATTTTPSSKDVQEERTRAMLGGNNERDDELLMRAESARKAKTGGGGVKGGSEAAVVATAERLTASAGDLRIASSSSLSHSPLSQRDRPNSPGDGRNVGDGRYGTKVSGEKKHVSPNGTNSSSRPNESKGGDHAEDQRGKSFGGGGHAPWEAALEQNGTANPVLKDLIRTVTPEIHRVSSEESKAFMSDFQLQELNPVARMAYSQVVFSPTRLTKRHHQHRHSHHHDHHHHHHNHVDVDNPLQRKDIFYSGSLRNIPEFQSAHSLAEYRQRVVNSMCEDLDAAETMKRRGSEAGDDDDGEEGSGDDSFDEESLVSRRGFLNRMVWGCLRRVFDVSLLKSPTFDIYCLSCLLCMLGFFVPFIYLPTLCVELGISSSKAAFIISIIGIANTVGRVAVGIVSDRSWADSLIINNLALVVGGVATALVPFMHAYPLLGIYAFVFGCCIAIFVSLRSIIMVELMGLQKLTNAFGLVIMCQGISSFIGAPIAGILSDITGDYNISFYVAGICIGVSGLICFPLRRVAEWERRREERLLEEARAAKRRRQSKST